MKCKMNGNEVALPCTASCELFGDCVAEFECNIRSKSKSKSMTLCVECIKSEPYQKSFICAEYGGIWEPGDGCTHGVKKDEGGHA